MTNLSERAQLAATLTVPVICRGWDCIVSTLFFPPCQLSSYFLSYGSLALSACMTVCAASCKRGGLQGSRFATQRSSIKTNKARSSAKTPEIKDQVQDWALFQEAGSVWLVQGVWVLKEVSGAFVCSMPPYPAPLKSACFCPLHNLIEFFEPLICMHFVSKGVGEGGRQKCPPPRIPQESNRKANMIGHRGKWWTRASQKHSIHARVWIMAALCKFDDNGRVVEDPSANRGHVHSGGLHFGVSFPAGRNGNKLRREKLFVSWNLIFFFFLIS